MKYYYWQPGNITGVVTAKTTYEAAEKILEEKPVYCYGDQPKVYVGNNTNKEVRIWRER